MTVNNRIFYACQAVGIKGCYDTTEVTPIHGVQSVGINTSFNLEQAFELSMIQIYENIENLPDVEVTLEKVLDGYPLIYHMATSGTSSTNITGRSKMRSCVSLGIYGDDKDVVSGVAPVEVYMSGMYVGSVSYTLPVDGNCTESVTLVGNNKEWFTAAAPSTYGFTQVLTNKLEDQFQIDYNTGAGEDFPLALDNGVDYKGGIQRRENVRIDLSVFPKSIFGVLDSTTSGNAYDTTGGVYPSGAPRVHFQNCSISTDTGREDILELGRRGPYYRSPNFPVEVTCELQAIAISGDFVSAYEAGNPLYNGSANEGNNTGTEKILIRLNDGTTVDLGERNRLSSVSYGGGDATGGNVSLTYSYSNFNDFKVLHPEDPAFGVYGVAEQALTVT
jgi:hypothetical protein